MKSLISQIRNYQRRMLDSVVKSNPKLGLDQRAEDFVSIFESEIKPQSNVLDIGGGWGFYAEPFEKRGHSLTVVDVVKPGYQKAPVVVYDGIELPFCDKSFDVSLFITVLHHIPELEVLLEEAKRVTRHKVIVVEDIYHHELGRWWTILRDRVYNFEYFGHPCNFKKKDEWVDLFEKHGYQLAANHQVYTWLSGLRILNGVFVFNIG